MAYISVTNALNDNAADSDITLVGTNFTDVINGLSDGTKDLNVASISASSVTATGDIKTIALTDYSGVSTIVGWTSWTTKKISYKKVGKTITVYFYIEGVSDATSTTFTVPVVNATGFSIIESLAYCVDNSTISTTGYFSLNNASATVTCYKTMAAASTDWTATNNKIIAGQFSYEIA